MKILAIQFKYLGDAVILTPALKALVTQIPNVELHVLVAAEIAPLLENLSWIKKVLAMPRHRGKLTLSIALPFIKALRKENFDRTVDFGSNDRGALMSYLVGADVRLGSTDCDEPKWIQRLCYTQIVKQNNPSAPYFDLHFELLNAWNIKRLGQLKIELVLKQPITDLNSPLLLRSYIVCHISTSQPKKDWPIYHWATLFRLGRESGLSLIFSSGPSLRERKLLDDFRVLAPDAEVISSTSDLQTFLKILKNSKMLVCGDTGPLHFAEGMDVPVLGIFGVGNSLRQVAPIYSLDKKVCAQSCKCDSLPNNSNVCKFSDSCMDSVSPEVVIDKIKSKLKLLGLT